mmetsp:Transcript_16709/g.47541  ORF Transcript_16709/g.47541 Transcript_16709/m.47541 type:complete len:446 (+) Transcript_16709:60-1397(+)
MVEKQARAAGEALLEKLQKGEDNVDAAKAFIAFGTNMPDLLVIAALGNRAQRVDGCPKVLHALLEAKGNPNAVDNNTQAQIIHNAAYFGTVDTVKVLLDHRADINSKEPKMQLPPLNSAIAAGNAKVCLELLSRNADVTWKHEDGATALHVAAAWVASSHNASLRMPPLGKEPVEVVQAMLTNGVNPLQTEGKSKSTNRATGMTPLESFRREVQNSPWRQDPQIGKKFDQTAGEINKVLEQSESAMKSKDEGNKAFKEKKYEDALKAWAEARRKLGIAGVQGHHVAVLWNNEALCRRNMRDLEGSKAACDEGLKLYASDEIRKKLRHNLEECAKPLPEPTEEEKQKEAAEIEARRQKAQEKKEEAKTIAKKVVSSGDVYGPEGSGQKDYVVPPPFIAPMEEAQRMGLGPPPEPKPYWEVDSDDEPPRTTIGFLPAHPPFPEPPYR